MKKMLLICLLWLPLGVLAADDYDTGSYWVATAVDTHAGHFDDYVSDLSSVWRKSMDMLVEDGKVKSYRIFSNVHARTGEPDLWLLVEWTSAAAVMDAPDEYWDAQNKKLFGSMEKGKKANIARGEIRTIMGSTLMQELTFK
jgi:hypothetical protein